MSLLDAWVVVLVVGTLALFAAGVWVLTGLARRHRDDDPRASSKLVVAVVASLLLGAGGVIGMAKFQEEAVEGVHRTLVTSLNKTLGEGDYQEAQATVPRREETIRTILQPRLDAINATLAQYVAENPDAAEAIANGTTDGLPADVAANVTARTETTGAIAALLKERDAAEVVTRKLAPNHALWLQVRPLLDQHRDAEAEAIVLKALDSATVEDVLPMDAGAVARLEAPCARDAQGFCTQPLRAVAIEHASRDSHNKLVPVEEAAPLLFEHQREFNHQMDAQLKVLGYSMVTGFMVAPFVFAGGAILRRAFMPSDTVGFRPYPSKAAGFFLLLGAFGVLAIPFSAWALRDLHKRSIEGQIAL